MDFEFSARSKEMQARVRSFIEKHIAPRDAEDHASIEKGVFPPPFLEELKSKARAEGLWNLFLPGLKADEPGTQMSNLDYAPIAEILGRYFWSSEVFNCSAPDTGNMEVLHLFATPEQRKAWLDPLLRGEIRSCFSMTEPDVASSDPTNLATTIREDGDSYVISGRKWFISGAADPRCRISIVLGVSDPAGPSHERMSMILVPMNTPGVK